MAGKLRVAGWYWCRQRARMRGLRPSGRAVSYELLSLSERSTGKRLWGTLQLG